MTSIIILATVSIIALFALVFVVMGMSITDIDDAEGGSDYAVESMEKGSNIGGFESSDLNGNTVSDAIFADKDVTVVNVWATFCGPCKEEMPELAALSEELPDNAQIVGIVIDAPTEGTEGGDAIEVWGGSAKNIGLAKDICGEYGINYTNILASESVSETFSNVQAVPTTFIVDSSGNIICKPFVGADVEGYKKAVEDYLSGQ